MAAAPNIMNSDFVLISFSSNPLTCTGFLHPGFHFLFILNILYSLISLPQFDHERLGFTFTLDYFLTFGFATLRVARKQYQDL